MKIDLDARLTAEFWCWVLDMPDDDYPTFLETVLFEARPSNRRLRSSGHFSGNEPKRWAMRKMETEDATMYALSAPALGEPFR